jgi:hypothetical protein
LGKTFAHCRRGEGFEAVLAPIEKLPLRESQTKTIGAERILAGQSGAVYVMEGKDQVVAFEPGFVRQKQL